MKDTDYDMHSMRVKAERNENAKLKERIVELKQRVIELEQEVDYQKRLGQGRSYERDNTGNVW